VAGLEEQLNELIRSIRNDPNPSLLGHIAPQEPRPATHGLHSGEEPSQSHNYRRVGWHDLPLNRLGSLGGPITHADVGSVELPNGWSSFVANGRRIANTRYNPGRGNMDVEWLTSDGRVRRVVSEDMESARQNVIDSHNAALPHEQHRYARAGLELPNRLTPVELQDEPSTSSNWRRFQPQADPFDSFMERYMAANPGASINDVERAFRGEVPPSALSGLPSYLNRPNPTSEHFEYKGDSKELFDKHIAPFLPEKDFHDQYFGGFKLVEQKGASTPGQMNDEFEHLYLDNDSGVGKGLRISGALLGADKNHYGTITRYIYPESGVAYHGYLSVPPATSGTGINKGLAAAQMRVYQKLGINEVHLSANIDAGSYAWAKYGYVPNQHDWNSLRDYLRVAPTRSAKYRTPGAWLDELTLRPQDRDAVNHILDNPNPKAIWDLADIQAKPLEDNSLQTESAKGEHAARYKGYKDWPIGKRLLWDRSWHGALGLDDNEAMRRFWSYVGSK
jgi:hypothetical protein